MKKVVLLFIFIVGSQAFFAQNEQKEGDTMAAAGNYQGAAMMYRICMENNNQCLLKLFKLIYENKIDAQFTDELYQLIDPLAKKKNAEGQYYLGMLYRKGMGGVSQDNVEAKKWFESSARQRNTKARDELKVMQKEQKKQPKAKKEKTPKVKKEKEFKVKKEKEAKPKKEKNSKAKKEKEPKVKKQIEPKVKKEKGVKAKKEKSPKVKKEKESKVKKEKEPKVKEEKESKPKAIKLPRLTKRKSQDE